MDTAKPAFAAPALALAMALMLMLMLASTPMPAGAEAVVKPPPVREVAKRRSVRQVIEPTPRIVTHGYRPTLGVGPPALPLTAPPALPGPPVPLLRLDTCDAGGCFDSGGARVNGGGAALLGPQGQLCMKGVLNAQCF